MLSPKIETERLIILINANKLQFNQDTISIMNKTQAFAEYIIHHSKQFINNLNLNYEFNTDSIYKIISNIIEMFIFDCFVFSI